MCSLSARGLWIDMICIMHGCDPYGHLSINGKDILPAILGRRVGELPTETERLLAELAENGVYRKTPQGTIYSPRMIRDEARREIRASGGIRSLENPNVPRPKPRTEDLPKDTFIPSPSSSFSDSSSASPSDSPSTSNQVPFANRSRRESAIDSSLVAEFENIWASYPERAGPNPKSQALREYATRRNSGTSQLEIHDGVQRYAAYIQATGKAGTEYVQMAKTFLGPDARFAETWDIPATATKQASARHPGYGNGSKILSASELIKKVRGAATEFIPYSGARAFPIGWEGSFSSTEARVIKAIGATRILTEVNEGTLVSQLAKALEEAE